MLKISAEMLGKPTLQMSSIGGCIGPLPNAAQIRAAAKLKICTNTIHMSLPHTSTPRSELTIAMKPYSTVPG